MGGISVLISVSQEQAIRFPAWEFFISRIYVKYRVHSSKKNKGLSESSIAKLRIF